MHISMYANYLLFSLDFN